MVFIPVALRRDRSVFPCQVTEFRAEPRAAKSTQVRVGLLVGGGIAIDDGSNGGSKMGKAEAFSSKGKAERAALADCRSKGGHKCTLEHAYHDQCVAVAWGDTLVSTMSAENSERASQLAIERCSNSTTNCGIYYTGCSYPERVQ